ncbi:MAG: PstS family phosphate ABC transporter substrate-binding protein [Phycisphaeraceae bacterium]|nr:PstS family phosphate ABC transporter substrate-binding protein [Phycisphaeraceae bacterium]
MKCGLFKGLLAGTAMAIAATASIAASSATHAEKEVKIDGSSTVYPITEAVAEEFMKANRGINVTVGVSGTGGGFKKFTRGETDISNASRPILAKEIEDAKKNGVDFIELPVCFDALTVVINKENTWAETMTTTELKKLWEPAAQGKVMRWSDIRPDWPNQPIKLFGAGTDSGTFDYFTEAIVGKAKSSRGDFTASEDDNILVRGVEGDKYALGFFGYSYYAAHDKSLKAVKVDWDKDELGPVGPSMETVINGTYNPLSRPLFIYVNRRSAQTKPEVRQFVEFYLKNAPKLSKDVKMVQLPDSVYELAQSRFSKMETGTAFGGESEVGVSIHDLMKRPLKN